MLGATLPLLRNCSAKKLRVKPIGKITL